MSEKLKIIFMGTPEFAVPSLEILVRNGVNVVAVITAPDKPKGRGKKLGTSPVKDFSVAHELPVLQPTNLKSPEFQEQLASYQADLQVVVAFRMLPEAIWDMPRLGTFNLHASLLPQYRGAAPINWAIINGEKETGATTFFLKHEIDTGNIIFQEKEDIREDDNVGSLYERLMHKGAELVFKTVKAVESGDYPQLPQISDQPLRAAPKLFPESCEINWEQPADEIRNFVRGLSPYPGAWTMHEGKKFKIFEVAVNDDSSQQPIGKLVAKDDTILVSTAEGALKVLELQAEGKKRMRVQDYLRGNKL
ncbi:MAG: methionyl-tRNA formyltransferase [Cyclobacteriaceae bacterium]